MRLKRPNSFSGSDGPHMWDAENETSSDDEYYSRKQLRARAGKKGSKQQGAVRASQARWTSEEDEALTAAVTKGRDTDSLNWAAVKVEMDSLGGEQRTVEQLRNRWNLVLNPSIRKGSWNPGEDEKLRALVSQHGAGNWKTLAVSLPGRNSKQCHERWTNVLDPSVKRGEWTGEEDSKILQLVGMHGTSWSLIATFIPGRPANSVKNRWYTKLKKVASSTVKDVAAAPHKPSKAVKIAAQHRLEDISKLLARQGNEGGVEASQEAAAAAAEALAMVHKEVSGAEAVGPVRRSARPRAALRPDENEWEVAGGTTSPEVETSPELILNMQHDIHVEEECLPVPVFRSRPAGMRPQPAPRRPADAGGRPAARRPARPARRPIPKKRPTTLPSSNEEGESSDGEAVKARNKVNKASKQNHEAFLQLHKLLADHPGVAAAADPMLMALGLAAGPDPKEESGGGSGPVIERQLFSSGLFGRGRNVVDPGSGPDARLLSIGEALRGGSGETATGSGSEGKSLAAMAAPPFESPVVLSGLAHQFAQQRSAAAAQGGGAGDRRAKRRKQANPIASPPLAHITKLPPVKFVETGAEQENSHAVDANGSGGKGSRATRRGFGMQAAGNTHEQRAPLAGMDTNLPAAINAAGKRPASAGAGAADASADLMAFLCQGAAAVGGGIDEPMAGDHLLSPLLPMHNMGGGEMSPMVLDTGFMLGLLRRS